MSLTEGVLSNEISLSSMAKSVGLGREESKGAIGTQTYLSSVGSKISSKVIIDRLLLSL